MIIEKEKGALKMKGKILNKKLSEIDELCNSVRHLVNNERYEESIKIICEAMKKYPHAPQPHNLLGIVLEKKDDHLTAMKHFRAALALDPTYIPTSHNLNVYGTFFSDGRIAFDETDLKTETNSDSAIIRFANGIGRVESKTKVEYDKYGVGHIVRR